MDGFHFLIFGGFPSNCAIVAPETEELYTTEMASLAAAPTEGETKEPTTAEGVVEVVVDPNYKQPEKVSVSALLEKDNDDEAMKKYKESLLGPAVTAADPNAKPVEIMELRLLFEGRDPLIIPFHREDTTKAETAVVRLKESESYTCQLVFKVNHEIVSGLQFVRGIYRKGIRVDKEQIMVGSFAPSNDPVVFKLEEDAVPSGMLARGTYKSFIKLIDDDKCVHADVNYAFKITKKW